MFGNKLRDFRNRVSSVVVLLNGVAVTVAVKVIDHRITLAARLIIRRQQNAIVTCFAEDLRSMSTVVKRLTGEGGKRAAKQKHETCGEMRSCKGHELFREEDQLNPSLNREPL